MTRTLPDAFIEWVEAENPLLAVPISVGKRTRAGIHFSFVGYPPEISGWIGGSNLCVSGNHDDDCWDLIFDDDCVAEKSGDGFFCALCLPEAQKVFPSKDALWREHVFERFGAWISTELATATGLVFCAMGGATWAYLVEDDVDQENIVRRVPLPATRPTLGRRPDPTDTILHLLGAIIRLDPSDDSETAAPSSKKGTET